MNSVLFTSPETAAWLAQLAINTWVQSTLVIAAGLLAVRILRAHGAAVHSAILRTTVLVVVLCPVTSWMLARSGWSGVPIELPRFVRSTAELSDEPTDVEAVAFQGLPEATFDWSSIAETPSDWPTSELAAAPMLEQSWSEPAGPIEQLTTGPLADPDPAAAERTSASGLTVRILSLLWLSVSIALLLRIAIANWIVSSQRMRGRLADGKLRHACAQTAAAMGVEAPPVWTSPSIHSPCLVGIWHPVILLPSAMQITRNVFVHELAHLRRRDCAWQMAGSLMSAILWFQPLTWMLTRRLELAADEVADDFVVQFGDGRRDYARQLVEIAESFQPQWSATCAGAGIVSLKSSLARRVMRILDTSRSPSTRAGLVALGTIVTAAGVCCLAVGLIGLSRAQAELVEAPQPPVEEELNSEQPVEAIGNLPFTVRGRVRGPDGSLPKGTRVYVGINDWGGDDRGLRIADPIAAELDDAGRFELSFLARDLFENPERVPGIFWQQAARAVYVVARAPGYGPAWQQGIANEDGTRIQLRLVEDLPIEGRLLTIEGAPAAGVQIRMHTAQGSSSNDLGPWLEALREGQDVRRANAAVSHVQVTPQLIGIDSRWTTDEQGRFRITGLGRDRVARLIVHGSSAGRSEFLVASRDFEPVLGKSDGQTSVYGSQFEYLVAPSQPVVGVVRDADTGLPLGDVAIESYRIGPGGAIGSRMNLLRTATNNAGEFRLEGLPKGAGHVLLAVPSDDMPYFMREIAVPETQGLEPIQVDVELHRGIWIRGRVLDAVSREPLMASLHYLPFLTNEAAGRLPEFHSNGGVDGGVGHQHRYQSKTDGSFRVVGLPGRGVVGAVLVTKHRLGARASKIAGADERGILPTYRNPMQAGKTWPHVMVEINPSAGQEQVEVTLEADPGAAVEVRVTDPAGQPLSGFQVSGEYPAGFWPFDKQDSIAVAGIAADETRLIVVQHRQRGLSGLITVSAADGERQLTLSAGATVRGRLIDDEGEPLGRATIYPILEVKGARSARLPEATSDADGRFELTAVPGGANYRLRITSREPRIFRDNVVRFTSVAGQKVELGDVLVSPRSSQQVAKKPAPQTKVPKNGISIRGRVLNAAGEPMPNVPVYTMSMRTPVKSVRDWVYGEAGRTGPTGHFQVNSTFRGLPGRGGGVSVLAHAPGHAIAWATAPAGKDEASVVLESPADHVIRGKLIDTEGQPLANATVTVTGLLREPSGTLEGFFEAWKNDWNIASMNSEVVRGNLNGLLSARSDAQGQFELRGVGRERVAIVEIDHPSVVRTLLWIVNRPGFDPAPLNLAARQRMPMQMRRPGMIPQLVGADFRHVLEAGRTIQGTVYTGAEERPIAGATVRTVIGSGNGISTISDDNGRYVLRGVPRHQPPFVLVSPPASQETALMSRRATAPNPTGRANVQLDVELMEGVVITGRLVDPTTGKGVRASVRAVQLPDNEYAKDPRYDSDMQTAGTGIDGKFRLAVIPGPGVVMAQVSDREQMAGNEVTPFRQARLKPQEAKQIAVNSDGDIRYFTKFGGTIESLSIQNAAAVFDVRPEGPPVNLEMQVDRGKTAEVQVLDDQGQPLTGVYAAGVTESWPITYRLQGSRCRVLGIGKKPRKLVLLHPERGLGAVRMITGDEGSPVRVKLSATGAISGRVLDEGAPLENADVRLNYSDRTMSELYRFAKLKDAGYTTGDDGRFAIQNLIPGQTFYLRFHDGDQVFHAGLPRARRTVASGEERDYQDLKLRRVR